MDAPGRYQKAGQIDFTTHCLALYPAKAGPAWRLAFGQQPLRVT
jgi:hypothetical protein